MLGILSRFSSLFIDYISHDLDSTKIHLHKLFVRYLVIEPAVFVQFSSNLLRVLYTHIFFWVTSSKKQPKQQTKMIIDQLCETRLTRRSQFEVCHRTQYLASSQRLALTEEKKDANFKLQVKRGVTYYIV